MIPLELQKWLKCTTNVQNIPKPNKMNKTPPKRWQNPWKLKCPKYHWILKNKQNTLESSKNDQNTPKLSLNTLGFFDFVGISVALKLFRSLWRIIGHSTLFSNFKGYFFNHYRWMGHFGHLRGIEIWMLILAIFWDILVILEVFGIFYTF